MNFNKRIAIVVFVATAFVVGFFSNAVANDFTNKSNLKAAIKSLERDMADLEQSKILLGLKRKVLQAIRENGKSLILINQQDKERQESYRQLGMPVKNEPLFKDSDVWNEKKECDYLREIATIEKEEEQIRRDEIKGSKLLRELKELLCRLEALEKKK